MRDMILDDDKAEKKDVRESEVEKDLNAQL